MKKYLFILGIYCLFPGLTFAAKFTVTTGSSVFNPSTTTAKVGDIIEFVVTSSHTATQVSQSTWNSNQSTPLSGGFNYGVGTFTYTLTSNDVGTIYFVCIPHVSIGMKGTIIVQAAENVPVTGVTLNKQTTTLNINSSETLVATVAPTNATNKNVTWSTSDATVATVNASGMVTGLKAGNTTITVTTQDGSKTAACAVTVQAANVAVSGVTLNKQSTTLSVTGSEILVATIAPANATNKNVTWSTSDATVATVNSSGIVTGLKAGNATITVTTQDGGKTATCAVTVQAANIAVTGVTLNKQSTTLSVNGSETLVATVAPANATNKNVTWSTSDATVATVNASGMVTGLKVGNATITVTTQDGGKTATCTVTVQSTAIAVTGVLLNKTTTNIPVSGSEILVPTIIPANATNKDVSWSTSDATVATVDDNGTVTGVKAGNATITVTTNDGGKTATCTVTVQNVLVTGVLMNKLATVINTNNNETLVATVVPANATNKNVTWSTSDPTVATVDASGKVTGLKAGSTNITVTTHDGGKIATCIVTVETVTSVETVDVPIATFYPNPTEGIFTLNFKTAGIYNVTIVNALGQKLLLQKVNGQSQQMDISSFPSGIYFLMIDNGKQRRTVKILKK